MKAIYRDVGDTAPAITTQLLVGGSPINLTGASVIGIIGGTVGSGVTAAYARYVLAATWTSASAGAASIAIPMNPSGLAPSFGYPCATAGRYNLEVRLVDSTGNAYQWPARAPIPFIVRPRV
jgi:hypothetical protein